MKTLRLFQSFASKFCTPKRSTRGARSMILVLGAISLLSSAAFGQLPSCSDLPGILIPDGTTYKSFSDAFSPVPPSGVATFAFAGFAGHSYTIEVAEPVVNSNNFQSFDVTLRAGTISFAGDQCNDATAPVFTTGVVTNTLTDPASSLGNFIRKSFIAPTTHAAIGQAYVVIVRNRDTTLSHYLSIRVTDTTLYNPRWSTTQGYITVYSFMNTTNQTIHGTLTLNINFGTLSIILANMTYSLNGGAGIAPGGQLLVAVGPTLTVDMPANQGGTATLAYDGPPGALVVDAYFANSTSLVPAVFAPRNSQH